MNYNIPANVFKASTIVLQATMVVLLATNIFVKGTILTPEPVSETTTIQQTAPTLLQFNVPSTLADGRAVEVKISARQILNTEEGDWCELAWVGAINRDVGFAGTIIMDGQMMLNDVVNRTEDGLLREVEYELKGKSLRSQSCELDILTVEVTQR